MVTKKAGQIVLFKFPQTDLATGKLRPALLLKQISSKYGDWLICGQLIALCKSAVYARAKYS
jgi:hypothetical protein